MLKKWIMKRKRAKKLKNLREEVGKYVAKNFGEQYVEESLSNYDTLCSGGTIGGFVETASFVHMVETVKAELLAE